MGAGIQTLEATDDIGALRLARRLGDADCVARSLASTGIAELWGGVSGGRAKLEQALALAVRHGLVELAGRTSADLALWSLRARDLGRAEEQLQDGLEYTSERDLDRWRLRLLAYRSRCELDRGRWAAATDWAAITLGDSQADPHARAWALLTLGLVRARRGDPDVFGPLDEALAIARTTEELHTVACVASARAEAACLAGGAGVVPTEVDRALAAARRRGARCLAAELEYWRRESGHDDGAPRTTIAGPFGLMLRGRWDRASKVWRELGCPYESAIAQSRGTDPQRALETFRNLGARPAAIATARAVRERGGDGSRTPRSPCNPAGLTDRELEVLALVADGLRNADIAQRLVVSQKTAAHHVSAILRKLGARCRGEATAEAHRRGIV